MPRVKDPEGTRRRLLAAAGDEFWRRGYRGGSLNELLGRAGLTKGAAFHHFSGKEALVLAWLDEVVAPAVRRRWVEPLAEAEDPVAALQHCLEEDLAMIEREGLEGILGRGCPVANLAADTAAVDEPVRRQLDGLYGEWRGAIAGVLARGRAAGAVHPHVVPEDEAAFLVGALAGIATTGKASRDLAVVRSAFRAARAYVETLRAPAKP